MTYYEWLKTQPAGFQDDAIGPVRGRLLREGGLTAKQFSDWNLGTNFQPLTLDEMKAKEPEVFDRVAGGATGGASGEDKKDLHSGAESGILDNKGDGALDFKQIEGEHSVQQDSTATNPNFGTGTPEYKFNCGNCTVAYEMRRRGFDVEAMPRILMPVAEWEGMFEDFQRQALTSRTKVKVTEEIEKKILQWGEGARGTIYGAWDKGGAPFFSVEVNEGKVMFVDGQKGKDDVRRYFNKMKPSSIIYGRLDKLKTTDAVKIAVKNKEI